MPDLTNGNSNSPNKTNGDQNSSGTFSFQSQGNTISPAPVPTAPFETISYQAPAGVTAPPEPAKTVVSSGEDIKLGQKETPTEIPTEIPKETPTEIPTGVPQQGSFLERYKTVETAEEEKSIPPEPQKLEEIFSPSGQPPPETKPPAPSEKEYKMPELPKSSIFSKLLPIALFLLIIALAIFLGMKFLPGLRGAKQVELTWWGLWEDEKTMQSIIDAYKKEQPNVTIHYVKKIPKNTVRFYNPQLRVTSVRIFSGFTTLGRQC